MARKPLVYKGRIRIFDPEPGEEIYLIDHPAGDGEFGPSLAACIEDWSGRTIRSVGPASPPLRITVEEVDLA